MHANRFDTLTRSLGTAGSRRRALTAILGGSLGLLGWQRGEDAAAHNASKACKKKSGQQKKKCLKKAKQHNATHTVPVLPPPAPPPICEACDQHEECEAGGNACYCLPRTSGQGSCCGLIIKDGKNCETGPFAKCPGGDGDCPAGSFCGPGCGLDPAATCFPVCEGL